MDNVNNKLDSEKFIVELKQTTKGIWYVGSVKIRANFIQEMDNLIDMLTPYLQEKIAKINKGITDIEINSREIKKDPSSEIILNDEEKILFEKLKSMRLDLAKEENVPPFVVFHDSVLKKFARFKPMTKEEMLNIGGVGERSFGKYGVYFLKVIRSNSGEIA